jgi:hypothetical protein
MRAIRQTIASLILAFVSVAPAAAQVQADNLYRDPQYGFSVEIPPGAPVCRGPIGASAAGIVIFLDAGVDGCDATGARPFVAVFGRYNTNHLPSPEAELRRACALVAGQRLPPPDGLLIDGLDSAACRVNRADNWIEILVIAQAGDRPAMVTPEPSQTPTVQEATAFVNYTAVLHTNARRFDPDLTGFRRILSGVMIYK